MGTHSSLVVFGWWRLEMATEKPTTVLAMEKILASMGLEDYDAAVVDQLLEFTHRYVGQVLADARVYSKYAKKPAVDLADARLAIQSRANEAFSQVPPREFLLSLATKKNATPLPIIPSEYGLRLPPPRHTLTAPNYHGPGMVQGSLRPGQGPVVDPDQDQLAASSSRKRKRVHQVVPPLQTSPQQGVKSMDVE